MNLFYYFIIYLLIFSICVFNVIGTVKAVLAQDHQTGNHICKKIHQDFMISTKQNKEKRNCGILK